MKRTLEECLSELAALMAEWRADLVRNLDILESPELTPFRRFELARISRAMSFRDDAGEQAVILARQTADWKISYVETDRLFWLTSDIAVFGDATFQPHNKMEPFAGNAAWVRARAERAMVSAALIEATGRMYVEYLSLDPALRKEVMLNRSFARPDSVRRVHERGKALFGQLCKQIVPSVQNADAIRKYISTLDIPELPIIVSRKLAASTRFNEVWMSPEMAQQLREHLGHLQASAFGGRADA